MIRLSLRTFIVPVVATLVLLGPQASEAQIIPGPGPAAAECNTAIAGITGGDRTGSTWSRIAECGPSGVVALTTAISGARLSVDSVYLLALYHAGDRVRHPAIFATAREVASNANATVDARMMNLLLLLSQHNPALTRRLGESWTTMVTVPMGNGCRLAWSSDVYQVDVGALPSDYLARIATTTEGITASGSAPQVVKDLARCVRTMITREYPERVPTSAITLAYVCGDKFRVSNASSSWVEVRFRVANTTDAGDLVVAPQASVDFFTHVSGRVLLEYMGQVIRERNNGGVPC